MQRDGTPEAESCTRATARLAVELDLPLVATHPIQFLREEYAHIPVEDYLRARLTIITRLLDREMLFSSPLGQRVTVGHELPHAATQQ